VTDSRTKDRVKMMQGTSPDGVTSEHPMIKPNAAVQSQALQVLTMAQRTAEEHVTGAHQQADKIRKEALAAAEQIGREAQAHAHTVRRDADKVLYDARAAGEQVARDNRARTEEAQRAADQIVSDAQAKAEAIAADAQARADQLALQAQQRYEDVVGGLSSRREGLQQQIEALERFDREYRGRLTSFMQNQLRALWADQPQVVAEEPDAESRHQPRPESQPEVAPQDQPTAEVAEPSRDDAEPQEPGTAQRASMSM
jgi:cell division septum initiation protein DivIVA